MLTVMSLYFILLVLKQVNVVAVVISKNPYAQICVPDVAIDLNVFNLF